MKNTANPSRELPTLEQLETELDREKYKKRYRRVLRSAVYTLVDVYKRQMVLITYDVNTEDAGGRKRLRQIAKQCVNYGQRVQNSVFECLVDAAQCKQLQQKLRAIMDEEKDSLRFYYLGNKYETCIEHFGAKAGYAPEGALII